MRVLLRASALTSSENISRIPALLDFALQGKHDVLLDPGDDPETIEAWAAWRRAVGILSEASQRAIDDSNQRQALRWSDLQLVVEDPAGASRDQLSLSVPDAITFLQKPLEIGLEDETSDRCFLDSVVPPPLRKEWRRLQHIEAIKLWNLGGVTNVPRRLQTRAEADPSRRSLLRLHILIDSDTKEAWQEHEDLPKDPRKAVASARGLKIAFHVLRRRMSENYTPPAALKRWVETQHGIDQPAKRAHADAFAHLSPERRHHHHLKHGLRADEEHLYASQALSPEQRAALKKKLGDSTYGAIAEATEDELRQDGVHAEMLPVFQAILRLA